MNPDIPQDIHVVSEMTQALPKEFPFYHMGNVQIHDEILPGRFEELSAFGYSFQGEMRGLLILLFDAGLDASTYAEMGNILASRIATQLSQEKDLDVMISPPRRLSRPEVAKLIDQDTVIIHRTYMHLHNGKSIPLQALILPAASAEVGNA